MYAPLTTAMQISIIIGIIIMIYAIYKYAKHLTLSFDKDKIITDYISLQRSGSVDKEIAGILL